MDRRLHLFKPAPFKLAMMLAIMAQAPLSYASDYKIGNLVIVQPWSRATPATAKVGGGYVVISNTGSDEDTLLAAETEVSQRTEFHSMSMNGDVMKMAKVAEPLVVKPGQSISFEPGGLHIMLLDLKAGLKQGQTFKGTLSFERAGTVEVEFLVGKIGAKTSPFSARDETLDPDQGTMDHTAN
jgi:periplasmic copper chaperone A